MQNGSKRGAFICSTAVSDVVGPEGGLATSAPWGAQQPPTARRSADRQRVAAGSGSQAVGVRETRQAT